MSAAPVHVQRTPSCACGGGCPRCAAARGGAPAGVAAAPDRFEQEADRLADRALRDGAGSVADAGGLVAPGPSPADLASVSGGLRSPSRALEPAVRTFMESRLGADFGGVRIHSDVAAAASAAAVAARAYTVGSHVVFGEREYAPETPSGRRLLAHELAHVVQQTGSRSSGDASAAPAGVVQRAPTVGILEEGFIGPPSATQRRAARSCPIHCGWHRMGTLHSMGLFYHQSRGATVAPGSAAATGIGTSLHFVAGGPRPLPPTRCLCDDFKIIQVLETTHPAAGRGNSYVDNAGRATPFYGDVYLSGTGEHAIPAGYPDAGERITTTHSIYDRPYREVADLGGRDLRWEAEACVVCVRNAAPDRILGGVTYGFTRARTPAGYLPVAGIGPDCVDTPSAHFLRTLENDPSVSGYDFEVPAPEEGLGDFPLPEGASRFA